MSEDQRRDLIETLGTAGGMVVLAENQLEDYARRLAELGIEPPIVFRSVCNRGRDFLSGIRLLVKEAESCPVGEEASTNAAQHGLEQQ